MFKTKRLENKINKLEYRIKELEECLCPCSQHDWIVIDQDYDVGTEPGDVTTWYTYQCKRCKKIVKTWRFLPTNNN